MNEMQSITTLRSMKRMAIMAAICVLISFGGIAFADSRPALPAKPQGSTPRIYVLDCGQLVCNNPEYYNLTRQEVADTNMPVTCYLVVHPKGVLLFDTGLSDHLIGRPLYENTIDGYGQIVTKTLRSQLADIGIAPTDVKYLAISHSHFDHVGNANDFPTATWLTSKAEQQFMFRTDPKPADFGDYANLQNNPKLVFEGDHDVFGDGTVVLKQTPGHTPGHQSLYVRLQKTAESAWTRVKGVAVLHHDFHRSLKVEVAIGMVIPPRPILCSHALHLFNQGLRKY